MLSVVIPSFFSSHLIKQRLKEINKSFKVIIIENSLDTDLKKDLEKNNQNVKVIIPEKNLGWGRAVNLGIKESSTDLIFITQPDVKLIDNCLEKLVECTKDFKDFTVLTPLDNGNSNFINYEIYKNFTETTQKKEFLLQEVDYVDLTWLINKQNLENILWDENIFLYFEAKDFAKRLKDNKKKIYIVKNIYTSHIGSSSHDSKLNHFAVLTRNWHYNWSRFYYLRKHFGYFYALKKNISILFKLLIKLTSALIFFNKIKIKYIYAEFSGLINSIFCRPASYRPYENLEKNGD